MECPERDRRFDEYITVAREMHKILGVTPLEEHLRVPGLVARACIGIELARLSYQSHRMEHGC
jgi:hypothetical protein